MTPKYIKESLVWQHSRIDIFCIFDQLFFNKGTRWNDILVSSAEAIKAYEIAEICKKAVEIYNEHSEQEDPIEELNECDEEFNNCNDPYMTLIAQYARNNKEHFNIK